MGWRALKQNQLTKQTSNQTTNQVKIDLKYRLTRIMRTLTVGQTNLENNSASYTEIIVVLAFYPSWQHFAKLFYKFWQQTLIKCHVL